MIRFIALAFCLVFAACGEIHREAEAQQAPELNTLSCVIDSVEWKAGTDGSNSSVKDPVSAEIGEMDGKRTVTLTAWRVVRGDVSSISLYAEGIEVGVPVQLDDGTHGRATFSKHLPNSAGTSFLRSDAKSGGIITIHTLDSAAQRIAGTFEFKLNGLIVQKGEFNTRYSAPLMM